MRIAIVEDDDRIREAWVNGLPAHGFSVVGAAGTLAEAFALPVPDVFLVDLALPDGSGLALIERLAGRCLTVVLSVFGDAEHVVRAIELGADGYLLKDTPLPQVAEGVRSVVAGGAPLSPAVARHILQRVRPAPRATATLTPREIELLESLAKGLTLKEVAAVHGISPHTVGDHVKAIYKKLSVHSRGEALYEAAQAGLIRMNR